MVFVTMVTVASFNMVEKNPEQIKLEMQNQKMDEPFGLPNMRNILTNTVLLGTISIPSIAKAKVTVRLTLTLTSIDFPFLELTS